LDIKFFFPNEKCTGDFFLNPCDLRYIIINSRDSDFDLKFYATEALISIFFFFFYMCARDAKQENTQGLETGTTLLADDAASGHIQQLAKLRNKETIK